MGSGGKRLLLTNEAPRRYCVCKMRTRFGEYAHAAQRSSRLNGSPRCTSPLLANCCLHGLSGEVFKVILQTTHQARDAARDASMARATDPGLSCKLLLASLFACASVAMMRSTERSTFSQPIGSRRARQIPARRYASS